MGADNVLLVPGTSGNKLMLDVGDGKPVDIGWPGALTGQAWLCANGSFEKLTSKLGFDRQQIIDTLSMEFADPQSVAPSNTTRRPGALLKPGPVIDAAYNQFESARAFVYDWRSDVRDSAQKLADFLANTPSGKRWKVVTHSQGGLVLIVAAKLLGKRAGGADVKALSRVVSHAAICACPLYGTVNAADALINGTNLSERFHASFLKIARSWPALYQMLPAWKDAMRWQGGSGSMLQEASWQGIDIDLGMLARARELRSTYLANPFSWFSTVKLRLTMSRASATHNFMLKSGASGVASGSEPGDTLVPAQTTRALMTDAARQASLLLGGDGDVAEHFMILNDPAVASDIRSFFKQ